MSLKTRKYLWLLIWILLIASGPLTVLINTDLSRVGNNQINLINFFQRMSGLLAFTLISIQIVLGHWMNKWTQIIGSKAYAFHVAQGIFTYLLVLFHPSMHLLITYELSKSILDTLGELIPRLNNQTETYLSYGKLSLVLITITVPAGYFRTKPFFRRNWQKLHIVNYFLFYSIYLHMRVGSDITSPPFVLVSWVALGLVTFSALKRFVFPFLSKIFPQKANEITGQKA